jgi:ABC-2 type transport system ATP-binding protein
MRRRLDLAVSLIATPPVLFLDEPTTGLDPRSRLAMWELVETLVGEGTTVLLTTQYLDEADRLADRIAVIDVGRVIAEGTADELKDRVGGERLAVRVHDGGAAAGAAAALGADGAAEVHGTLITVPVRGRSGVVADAVRRLDAAGVEIDDVSIRRPTLDDVFLTLTGHAAERAEDEDDDEDERSAA